MVMNPQQPSQPRGGLLGLFDKAMKTDEDTGLSPLQDFAAALDPLILKDLRGGEGIRQGGVQRAASMSKNKTVDMHMYYFRYTMDCFCVRRIFT